MFAPSLNLDLDKLGDSEGKKKKKVAGRAAKGDEPQGAARPEGAEHPEAGSPDEAEQPPQAAAPDAPTAGDA